MKVPISTDQFMIGCIYLILIPALFWLALEFTKVKKQAINYEHYITRLESRLDKAQRFKEECPCCFIGPVVDSTVASGGIVE